ncbi:MAG: hypothetical protein A2X23_00990 [Chloroflexi bacterium GWC2_73_18]|nr:MAG: hypothetical protein A2X23_00990 [Chloroflexi bacterium GWC2_73_18]
MLLLVRLLALLLPLAASVRLGLVPVGALLTGLAIDRDAVETTATAAVGAGAMALLVALYLQFRVVPLARVAERLADGDLEARARPRRRGVDGRFAVALNAVAQRLSETSSDATTDRLTGIPNRQALLTGLFTEVERVNRYGRPLSVAFVDIDRFKSVNDTYGHHAGDVVLRHVAQVLRSSLRHTDLVGRYGGEEFMLVLTETDIAEAGTLSEKLRLRVASERIAIERGLTVGVTVSIGVAGGIGQQVRFDTIVRDADAAMYSAKSLGRNQTYVFAEVDDDTRVPRAPVSPAGRLRALEIGRAARAAAEELLYTVVAPLPHYGGRPSRLIAALATSMADRLDLPEGEVERIRVASLLHDIGKLAVPPEILAKPAPLTTSEWQSVVQHPRIGQLILEQSGALREAVPIILHHHERFSGHGYPYGLRGSDIPLGARIVAVADAYDAMIHDRPYKRAVDHAGAVAELRRHAGTQFDPELVGLFCDLFGSRLPDEIAELLTADPAAPFVASRRRRSPRSVRPGSAAAAG